MTDTKTAIGDFLQVPWLGLRPDLVLHPGPIDYDGQGSWILEDPVRGNNFRLGHAEGELIYRLTTESNIDSAISKLYQNTTLRPSIEEIVNFIHMLQKESLAVLPDDEIIRRESQLKNAANPNFLQQIMKGNIFFRIPVLRPDAFLTKTLPWISLLWTPFLKGLYLLCGLIGLGLTLQEIEIYFNTVSYLFTPQGGLAFFICLGMLKIGHEFAHAYTAKAMGLHVRSMGIMLIVVWPLLYTDTTDAWKIPDRRKRMQVSAAGVLFELTVAGLALMLWAFSSDGIFRSLMFFLSGTSLISSILINLNPFMRYDGYYLLMDFWGIDNLRPRAFAVFKHGLRKLFLDWKGPAPEIHPYQRSLIIYGFLAALYRLFIGISIAVSVYYLFFPILGMIVFAVEIWLFLIHPVRLEILTILRNRQYLGSKFRLAVTSTCFLILIMLFIIPLPQVEHVPCIVQLKGASSIKAPDSGQLAFEIPQKGQTVNKGDLLARIKSDAIEYELQQVQFDIQSVCASIQGLGTGGEQESYRKWLMAEEERLKVSLEKYIQAVAQLEIRSPINGMIMDVNYDLYKNAFISKDTYLFTVASPNSHELKAFIHEKFVGRFQDNELMDAKVCFAGPELPRINARLLEKSKFPVNRLPNENLFDFAGGPIVSAQDLAGRRPKDAYFAYTFEMQDTDSKIAHGMPSWLWVQTATRSFGKHIFSQLWKKIIERGLF